VNSYFSYKRLSVGVVATVGAILFVLAISGENTNTSPTTVSNPPTTQVASVVRFQSSTSTSTINLVATRKAPVPINVTTFSKQQTSLKTKEQESSSLSHNTIRKSYYVVRVVDGDTIVARMNGQSVKVRLLGINTPETVDPRKPVECFGKEASARAKTLLTGTWVFLETDPTQSTYDKYGRLLAYVFLKDGTNFDRQMILDGYGYEYTYRHRGYKYQKEFKQAQQYAKIHERGLWAPGVCKIKS